jgi:hypothetical protein
VLLDEPGTGSMKVYKPGVIAMIVKILSTKILKKNDDL